MSVSIVIPAKNEGQVLGGVLQKITENYPDYEVIVVDDGSTDDTAAVIDANNVKRISHPYSIGNGGAIKSGARAATGDVIVFMDGDGQHRAEDVQRLVDEINKGYDLVVGARRGLSDQASYFRAFANGLYNRFASLMVGHKVEDLTSGFRAVKREKFLKFVSLLPNGFSYPTTSTMAFFRSGFSVCYIPIQVDNRVGESHISLVKDGIRFFLIIFKVATLYSPLKVFFPLSVIVFFLGLARYIYTYAVAETFTNMSATLFASSLTIFLVGLVSEQVANLIYMNSDDERD